MRIVICDDHQLLLEALATSLSSRGYVVEAVVTTPVDAVHAVALHDPDVLLLDVMYPEAHGLGAARRVMAEHNRTKVVLITGSNAYEPLVEALEIGVAGYLRKDQPITAIAAALEAAQSGRLVVDAAMLRQLRRSPSRIPQQRSPVQTLTTRERHVAELMADGLGTDEIVKRLGVSHSTVRTHVQNILLKLDVHTRLQAVAKLSADEHFTSGRSAHAS
jgi:two-component system, NarL family, nitrate/nitrite response regulator NarL